MQQDSRQPANDLLPAHGDEAGLASSNRVIHAYEQERLRLAREIHDGPAQILANAIFELEYFERLLDRDPAAVKAQLAQVKQDIRNGLADVRRFIYDLRSPALAEMGLFPALGHYVNDYQKQFGITVHAQLAAPEPHLAASAEVAVFRIVQEALQNVRKHAAASMVTIAGEIQGKTLHLSIQDDGRGFDTSRAKPRDSKNFGLTSMKERADLIGGELIVNSSPGHGTEVTLLVPLE